MRETILKKLDEIEKKENVKILHCIESGSRAWGFASPDSDYDVRFLYVRPKEFYLRLDRTRDVIEWQLDETLDVSGWDIRKALILLYKSNPTVFEWNSSPIVYHTTEEWKRISAVIPRYFTAKSGLYHYISTAKNNCRRYLKEESETASLKKYFYMLRPILACEWILANGTPPPIPFEELKERYLPEGLREDVDRLLEMKRTMPEMGEGRRIARIDDYIDRSIERIDAAIATMPPAKAHDHAELNALFLSLL